MNLDLKALGSEMSGIVREFVAQEMAPALETIQRLQGRVNELEARAPVPGEPGRDGLNGLPGRGIAAAVVRSGDGVLVLTLTDGETIEAGTVAGKDGKDGTPGKDGQDGGDGAPGRDGRDVEPEVIRGLVAEAVSQLPPPERGEQGLPGERGADGRDGKDGVDGRDGKDGASVTVDDVAPLITQEVTRQVAELPPPQDGAPGQDGRDGRDGTDGRTPEPEELRAIMEPLVRDAVTELPPAEAGPPGKDGQDGASFTAEDAEPLITAAVERAVAAIPTPENGRDGRDGQDGRGVADLLIEHSGDLVATFTDGATKRLGRIVGTDGRDGKDGRDGRGFTGGQIDAQGHLHLTADDGQQIDLGRVRGADGRDGADGLNGRDGEPGRHGLDGTNGRDGADGRDGETFNLDDFNLEVGESLREFVLTFTKGEKVKSFAVTLPVVIDRGAWTERGYERGDSVTWGGSIWIAQRDVLASEKPGSSDGWRLSVKRGRDGKPGLDGKDATNV